MYPFISCRKSCPAAGISGTEGIYADASFMQMFSFPMIMSEPAKALQEPKSLLLSAHMAEKLFGSDWQATDPIGKMLTVNGEENFMIKSVFEDIPENSHIKFEVLLPLTTLAEALNYGTEWVSIFPAYLQLDPTADVQKLEAKLMKI